jgi:hydroxyethylthiazole kinase-like uncharacterized protein yjeF
MYSVSSAEMRDLEERTFQEAGIPASELMEKAGQAVFDAALRLAAAAGLSRFVVLAGKGNNGGDAFVAARLLHENGCTISLFLTSQPEMLKGEAQAAFKSLPEKLKAELRFDLAATDFAAAALIIDGLLGTGTKGAPREPVASWIKLVNASGCPILAIDLPSGLDADRGNAELAIVADKTLTFGSVKNGMITNKGPECCGRLEVANIGIPEKFLRDSTSGLQFFSHIDARQLLRRESFTIYKNQRGHIGVLGGSSFYGHAPFLTAEAALRCGSGLCTVLYPRRAENHASIPKALIVRRIDDDGKGFFNRASLSEISALLDNFSVLACGPGLSCHAESLPLLDLLFNAGKPLVLDADALNLLSLAPELLNVNHAGLLLTPHPGEMARLVKAFQINESLPAQQQALALAEASNSVVLLKGCRTIVADNDKRCLVNLSGCAALASAGSGDVLTGVCASFLGQHFDPFSSAALSAYLHGLAGEILCPVGSRGFLADDLLATLPAAIRQTLPIA